MTQTRQGTLFTMSDNKNNANKTDQIQLLNDRLDAMATQMEPLLAKAAEAETLKAENSALKAQLSGVDRKLGHEATMAKVDRIRDASRMPEPKGKYEWRFALIIPGQFNKDGSPKTMPHMFRWRCDHNTKAEAVMSANAALGYTWRTEDVLAYPVGFEVEGAQQAVTEPVKEELLGTPV